MTGNDPAALLRLLREDDRKEAVLFAWALKG